MAAGAEDAAVRHKECHGVCGRQKGQMQRNEGGIEDGIKGEATKALVFFATSKQAGSTGSWGDSRSTASVRSHAETAIGQQRVRNVSV